VGKRSKYFSAARLESKQRSTRFAALREERKKGSKKKTTIFARGVGKLNEKRYLCKPFEKEGKLGERK
jgi:hypothetical protein